MNFKITLIAATLTLFAYSCSTSEGAGSNPSTANPDTITTVPDTTITNPGSTTTVPDTTTTNPGSTTTAPDTTITNPDSTTTNPGTTVPGGSESSLNSGSIMTKNIAVSSLEAAGEMGAYFDGSNLVIKGQLNTPYEIQSVYLWIDNDFSTLPLNKVYKTQPTQFPYTFIPVSAHTYNFELQPDLSLLTIPVDPANLCQSNLYVAILINASVTNPDGTITNFSFWVSDYAFTPDQHVTALNEQGWFMLSLSCQ